MAYNVPTIDTTKFSFGPGVLKIAVAGTTPVTDVGAVRSGATFTVTRTLLDVFQGSPQKLVKSYCTKEESVLVATGIEWNLARLKDVLGAGEITGSTLLEFGGDMSMAEVSLQFIHQTPVGDCVVLSIWKARGAGTIAVAYGDAIHEFPYSFSAIEATCDWASSALAEKKKLWKMEIIKA